MAKMRKQVSRKVQGTGYYAGVTLVVATSHIMLTTEDYISRKPDKIFGRTREVEDAILVNEGRAVTEVHRKQTVTGHIFGRREAVTDVFSAIDEIEIVHSTNGYQILS